MAAFYASASTGLTAYACLKGRAQADKTWPHLLEWNEKAFGAWAQVHAAAEHAEAFEYGAQVSRLSSALAVLEAVAKGSKAGAGLTAEAKVTFNEALAAVKPMQQAACRHNDAVYHERVPPLAAPLPARPAIKRRRTSQVDGGFAYTTLRAAFAKARDSGRGRSDPRQTPLLRSTALLYMQYNGSLIKALCLARSVLRYRYSARRAVLGSLAPPLPCSPGGGMASYR